MHKLLQYTKNNTGDYMLIYIMIFLSKILENTLSTLRLIIVSNGKKTLGSILQGIIALVWILVTGVVIIDINKDVFKIFAFCIGSMVGSYLGSLIEEKIALGYNLTIAAINSNCIPKITKELSSYNIEIINITNHKTIIMISCKRKKTHFINNIIHKIDNDSLIINQKAKIFLK